MRLVQALDFGGRTTLLPNEQPGLLEPVGLTPEQAETSAWAVTPDGRRYGGAAAINLAFSVMWRTRLPWRLYWLPPVRRVQDPVYEWVARNRHRFPGDVPYCTQHPERCGQPDQARSRATPA